MVAIIDYDAGNTFSVKQALNRLGATYILTSDPETILSADKVILPGVGHAAQAMKALQQKNLVETIQSVKNPLLGVCLGMQLLCDFSLEGNTRCLGLIDGVVQKFVSTSDDSFQKVPHMGWNQIFNFNSPLFNEVVENAFVYFVHSYFVEDTSATIAHSNYNDSFSAAIQKDNFFGVQFHPEKSSIVGAQILQNFINL